MGGEDETRCCSTRVATPPGGSVMMHRRLITRRAFVQCATCVAAGTALAATRVAGVVVARVVTVLDVARTRVQAAGTGVRRGARGRGAERGSAPGALSSLLATLPTGALEQLLVLLLAHALAALLDQRTHGGRHPSRHSARRHIRPPATSAAFGRVGAGRGWCNGSTGSFGVPSRGSKPRPRAGQASEYECRANASRPDREQ